MAAPQPELPDEMAFYTSVEGGRLGDVDLRAPADPRQGLCWLCSDPLPDSPDEPVEVPGLPNAWAHPECVEEHHPTREDPEC